MFVLLMGDTLITAARHRHIRLGMVGGLLNQLIRSMGMMECYSLIARYSCS